MKLLIPEDTLKNYKCEEKIPLECQTCGKTFYRNKWVVMVSLNKTHPNLKLNACSRKCVGPQLQKQIPCSCGHCGKNFTKIPSKIKTSKCGKNFCSPSCSTSYHNNHKSPLLAKRSKLELYIERELKILFPNLEILFNDKATIGSELDVYVPSLRLAFELNGTFHYEPRFGIEKLERIQKNDRRKFKLCHDNDIGLTVIDTSSIRLFKEEKAKKFLDIIINIINENLTLC